MTRYELVEMIDKRKKKISVSYEYDYKYYLCKDFIEQNPKFNSNKLIDCEIWEVVRCVLCVTYSNFSEEECNKFLDVLMTILGDADSDFAKDFLEFIYFSYKADDTGLILEYLAESDKDKRLEIADRIDSMNKSNYLNAILDVEESLSYTDYDLSPIYKFANDDFEKFIDVIVLFIVRNEMNNDQKMFKEILDGLDSVPTSHDTRKAKKQFTRSKYNHAKLNSILGSINQYVYKCESASSKHYKNITRESACLDNALIKLDNALKKDGIINGADIVSEISDLEIRYAFLLLIDEHNNNYIKTLNNKLDELSGKNDSFIKALFGKYQIPFTDKDIESFLDVSLDELEMSIKILVREFGIPNNLVIGILKKSNYDFINNIFSFAKRKYIPISYIEENPMILIPDSLLFDKFLYNLKALNSLSIINPKLFYDNVSILFESSDSNFIRNVEVLKAYDLIGYLKTTKDFNFLLRDNLSNIIDRLLELGFEDYLIKDLGILNSNNLKRLELLKACNIPVEDYLDFRNIIDSKKFFVSDDKIDDYVYNAVLFKNKIDSINFDENMLNSFISTYRVYNFDGVLVSAPKVKKLLSSGKSIYDAIFTGLILNDDEYDRVINCIKGFSYKID